MENGGFLSGDRRSNNCGHRFVHIGLDGAFIEFRLYAGPPQNVRFAPFIRFVGVVRSLSPSRRVVSYVCLHAYANRNPDGAILSNSIALFDYNVSTHRNYSPSAHEVWRATIIQFNLDSAVLLLGRSGTLSILRLDRPIPQMISYHFRRSISGHFRMALAFLSELRNFGMRPEFWSIKIHAAPPMFAYHINPDYWPNRCGVTISPILRSRNIADEIAIRWKRQSGLRGCAPQRRFAR